MRNIGREFPESSESGGFPHNRFFLAYNLYRCWHSVKPPDSTEVVNAFAPDVVNIENGIFVLKGMIGLPREIFMGLYLGDRSFLLELQSKIRNGWRMVELHGAAGPYSVYDMACFLNHHGFSGILRVVDISNFPLDATRPYINQGNFGLKPDQFELVNESVLNLDPNLPVDAAFADVLTLYLSEDELEKYAERVTSRLTAGGFFITRDLVEPNGPPPPEKRSVAGKIDITELQRFLEKNFRIYTSQKEIQQMLDTMWTKVRTYPRKDVREYINPFCNAGLKLCQSIPTTTDGYPTDNPRIFYVNIFGK